MKKLIAALQFLTILPLGKSFDFQPVSMISFFPIAGLITGILLAIADRLFLLLWSPNVAALLDVVMLVFITGALHIDGLGDAADGLLGHRPREKALAIMKDSRIGVMGLVCILCGLSIKWAGIAGIEAQRSLLLIIIPAYARGGDDIRHQISQIRKARWRHRPSAIRKPPAHYRFFRASDTTFFIFFLRCRRHLAKYPVFNVYECPFDLLPQTDGVHHR